MVFMPMVVLGGSIFEDWMNMLPFHFSGNVETQTGPVIVGETVVQEPMMTSYHFSKYGYTNQYGK